ncbi:DUF1896 family protein [Alistipes finegoldii]|uniref:DUF1896 family protein n=1 Tax=Alistipes finegoldii TaxID=214856 RepID=UPI00242BA507|nr:DUF1896 family protein [Alistipes finegoldii]
MNQNNKPAELSYYGLYLLSYLKENHPDKAHDAAFVESRADRAAEMFEQARREGYPPEGAQEIAMAALLEGLRFSRYDTIIEVLWNEFAEEVAQSDAPAVALRLLPYMEGIFAQYPLSDDFAYSPEYEQLYTELTGAVSISLEEDGI